MWQMDRKGGIDGAIRFPSASLMLAHAPFLLSCSLVLFPTLTFSSVSAFLLLLLRLRPSHHSHTHTHTHMIHTHTSLTHTH